MTITSTISKKEIKKAEAVQGFDLREGLFNLIHSDQPGFGKESFLSLDELNRYRRLYMTPQISQEKGELVLLDR